MPKTNLNSALPSSGAAAAAPRSAYRSDAPNRRGPSSWELTPKQLAAWEIHEADRDEHRLARRRPTGSSIGCTEDERRFWTANRTALLKLGASLPQQSERQAFTNAGCVSAIMTVISMGDFSRDDLIHRVQSRSRYTYQHIGFLLNQMTGADADLHLWRKDPNGRYRLNKGRRKSALSAA